VRRRVELRPELIRGQPVSSRLEAVMRVRVGLARLRIDRRAEFLPFLGTLALFTMGYVGLAISLWPNIVPHSVSLWDAAAAPRSQAFLLVGTLFLLPVILFYSGWSYWVFRGKVRADVGYH
jgi:cytochrome d ubiquinol oxidase subunit II